MEPTGPRRPLNRRRASSGRVTKIYRVRAHPGARGSVSPPQCARSWAWTSPPVARSPSTDTLPGAVAPQSEKHHAPQLKHRKSATPNYPHSRTASSRIEFASYIISDMKTNCRRKPYFPRTGVCYKPKCRHMCETFPSPNRKMNNTKQHRVQ